MNFFVESLLAFGATIAFSVMLNIPKKELLYCGIAGGVGWFLYTVSMANGFSSTFSNFVGTICIAYLSRFFAIRRKTPILVFLISGIITLVPGIALYNTALNIILQNNEKATFYALETIKISCAIAFGIILVLSLPSFLFKKYSKKSLEK